MPRHDVPEGARAAARILLVDHSSRLLLLHAEEPASGHRFWLAPGGGLRPGERFEDAARRELREETGLEASIGPWVWTRRHVGLWNGEQTFDVYERFFVATTDDVRVKPAAQDRYVRSHRWWTVAEIQESDEDFAPRRLGELLGDIVSGNYPGAPIDCGA